jgi:hypothetical protein
MHRSLRAAIAAATLSVSVAGAAFALLLPMIAASAQATVLTFDPYPGCNENQNYVPCNGSDLPDTYGDRVTSIVTGGFTYGGDLGFTPNVTVSYGPLPSCLDAPGAPVCSRFGIWSSIFGDLSWSLDNNNDTPDSIEITFVADDGYLVTLYSVDLALINPSVHSVPCNPCALPISAIGDSGILFLDAGLSVAPIELTHTHVSFGSGVSSKTLTLVLDTTVLGVDSDLVGLDNIRFSQSVIVPEPATTALMLTGLVGLALPRRGRFA